MPQGRYLSLRRKLLAGFAVVCLLVAALLLIGHQFIEKSNERMERSLSAEVQPLARLNRLQSRIHQLRVHEIELPRLADFFAVRSNLDQLHQESQEFSTELATFLREIGANDGETALPAAWARYQADLRMIAEHAATMDMKHVETVSTFESALHFKRIVQALEDLSTKTERQARAARDAARSYQEQQRDALLLISVLGLFAIAAGFFWFARSLVVRVSVLHAAAQRIAEGDSGVDIELSGDDELTELGRKFDLMRHKVAERTRALQESEQRFRDIADSSSDWIWETDADLRFTYFSDRAADRLGRPLETLLGKTPAELLAEGGAAHTPEALTRHLEELAAHRAFRAVEYPVLTGDGSFRHIRLSGKPVFSADGSFLGYRGTGTDITELLVAQSELLGAEKLAALGGMVAGIAHEINTPIGIGVTAASYLQEKTQSLEQLYAAGQVKRSDMESYLRTARETSDSMATNLTRAAKLVKSFKQVAVDQSSEERRHFKLREYVGEILDSLRPRLKRTEHEIVVDCPADLELDSYPGALSQILTNLVMNSLIHGFEGIRAGRIEIAASLAEGKLTLRYSDNGCGMTETQAARVFEPFFTTRRERGGSGLGMHITQNLVTQKLKGTITCRSAPGCGVEFLITIPATPDGAGVTAS
jgi:PAS domain S-box-containing protein